jgi:hypothetical protein
MHRMICKEFSKLSVVVGYVLPARDENAPGLQKSVTFRKK